MYRCATIGFPDKAGVLLASERCRKGSRSEKTVFFPAGKGGGRVLVCRVVKRVKSLKGKGGMTLHHHAVGWAFLPPYKIRGCHSSPRFARIHFGWCHSSAAVCKPIIKAHVSQLRPRPSRADGGRPRFGLQCMTSGTGCS